MSSRMPCSAHRSCLCGCCLSVAAEGGAPPTPLYHSWRCVLLVTRPHRSRMYHTRTSTDVQQLQRRAVQSLHGSQHACGAQQALLTAFRRAVLLRDTQGLAHVWP